MPALADVFVIGAFVRILETAPAADIIDEDHVEVGCASFHIRDETLQGRPSTDGEPSLAVVCIGANDLDATLFGIFADLVGLVVRRTLLMLGRHAHILRRAEIRYFATPVQLTLHRCPFRGRRLRDVRELSSHDWPGSKRIQLLGEIAAP